MTRSEKLTIAQGICAPLLRKIRADLQRNLEDEQVVLSLKNFRSQFLLNFEYFRRNWKRMNALSIDSTLDILQEYHHLGAMYEPGKFHFHILERIL